jgi:DNA-binding IclR family transcriptional regulator
VLSGMRNLDGSGLNARSQWWADMLARRSGEAVWAGVLVDRRVHIVHQAFRPDVSVQIFDVDGAIPWHACALGQAIVANLDTGTQEALLAVPAERMTGLTVTGPQDLRQLLAMTRHRGYAVEAHAVTLGEGGIAAPVFDPSGWPIGAIGVVGPVERLLSPPYLDGLVESVCVTARGLAQVVAEGGAPPAGT